MKIFFQNSIQKALFDAELVGQISDGMWENSRPHNHWEVWSNAETFVDENNPRIVREKTYSDMVFKSNYNFNSKELLDIIGDRMLNICKLAEAGFSDSVIYDFNDYSEYAFKGSGKYWTEKRAEFLKVFNSYQNYEMILAKSNFSIKMMRKELNGIKELFKTV